MLKEIRQATLFTLVTMVLLGGGYHVALWGTGRTLFPVQAEGSLIRQANGTVVGSRLIAQEFERAEYFHPRPSAVNYNAAATGGSNYAPSNPDHVRLVRDRLDGVIEAENVRAAQVPSEMVTTSGAGLDPHIPPAAAALQIARVARSRGLEVGGIRDLVAGHTEQPVLGFLGRARVNVLELNLALDERFGSPVPSNGSTTTD